MKKEQVGQVELSRPLKIDGIPRAGIEEHIVAKPLERQALATRLKVVALKKLEAKITVAHKKGHMFNVTGGFYAELTQECVVTLEPVEEVVRSTFDLLMAPDYILDKLKKKKGPESSESEEAEPIEGGVLDLGELVIQFLAMELNPYPRKQGAAWEAVSVGESKDTEIVQRTNPFMKLVKDVK